MSTDGKLKERNAPWISYDIPKGASSVVVINDKVCAFGM